MYRASIVSRGVYALGTVFLSIVQYCVLCYRHSYFDAIHERDGQMYAALLHIVSALYVIYACVRVFRLDLRHSWQCTGKD